MDRGDLVPLTNDRLAELCRLRAIEVSVLAVHTDDGPTLDHARDGAEDQLDWWGEHLRLRAVHEEPPLDWLSADGWYA